MIYFASSPIRKRCPVALLAAVLVLSFVSYAPAAELQRTNRDDRALDQFIRGAVADEMEDRYRAVFYYQEALRYDSTSGFIYVALSHDYALLGNTVLAEELLNKALKVHPDYISALELQSILYKREGRLTAARDALKRLVDLAPDDPNYAQQLLSVEFGLGNYDEGERLYDRIVRKEGESELMSRQVLGVYMSAKQYDRAIKLLKTLLSKDSTDAALHYALGTCYLQKGDSTQGLILIRDANRIDPEEPRYWTGLAIVSLDRRQYEQTVSIVDSAVFHAAPTAGLLSIKGTALNRLGRPHDAILALREAISLDSTLYVAMGTLALIYDEADSVQQAVDLYEAAIRLSDSSAVYLNNLAYTLASRGLELEKAGVLVQRALKDDPKNSSFLDTMGWVKFGLGDYDEAIRWLKLAARETPDAATVLEHLGDAYAKSGSPGKAAKCYERALKIDPNNQVLRAKLGH